MQADTLIRRNPEPLAVDMDGETVMMDMETGNYFGINSVGSCIWNALETEQRFGALVEQVRAQFEVPEEATVEADLQAFLQSMLEQKLVEVLPA